MKPLRISLPLLAALCMVLAAAHGASAQCVANTAANSGFNAGYRGDVNLDLGDYGLILKDSLVPGCAHAAAQSLLSKVNATLASPSRVQWGTGSNPRPQTVGPFQGWLEGAHVTLIFAAALHLGGHGQVDWTLDAALQQVRDRYKNNPYPYGLDPYCGLTEGYGNSCMDDYAVGAEAYAWIAAYERYQGRSTTAYLTGGTANAANAVHAALSTVSSICIFNPSRTPLSTTTGGPCNSNVSELTSGAAITVSLNHGHESVGYGLGLMSLIAGAYVGIQQAGGSVPLSAAEKTIALKLFEEGQRATDAAGDALDSDCYGFPADFSTHQVFITTNSLCWDESNYKPKMFPVRNFYVRYVGTPAGTVVEGGVSRAAYGFDVFNSAFFQDNPVGGNFFNAGREVTYGSLGNTWLASAFKPVGFLDGIDSQGCAFGWSCDQDAPNNSLQVDFYLDGFATYVQSTIANGSSEAAVNSRCGGGTAHRFRSCLPAWAKGRLVYAYGLDAAAQGFSTLPGWSCANNPACVW